MTIHVVIPALTIPMTCLSSGHSFALQDHRKIFELASAEGQCGLVLVKLSELFNHWGASITKIYLGSKQEGMLMRSEYD